MRTATLKRASGGPGRDLSIALAAISCVLVIAACGSSGNSGNTVKNDPTSHNQFLQFSECMRSHGVSNFPDPQPGGGIQIGQSSGINPFSPSFKEAQAQCGKLLPGGGPGGGHPTAQAKAQMLAISKCMRAHGVTGFPDPTTTPPSGGPGQYQVVFGHDGVFIEVPNTIDTNSPAFQSASTACNFGPRGGK